MEKLNNFAKRYPGTSRNMQRYVGKVLNTASSRVSCRFCPCYCKLRDNVEDHHNRCQWFIKSFKFLKETLPNNVGKCWWLVVRDRLIRRSSLARI